MTGPRVAVPILFDGDWDSALIFTYGADLAFYERDLLRQLHTTKNRLVFADHKQMARELLDSESGSQLRQVNRSYVLAPLRVDRAAHAKLILLLRDDRGLLAVGSGNLGMRGYAEPGECFTLYHWSDDDPQHLAAFVAAKDFVDQVLARGLVDEIVRPYVDQAWQEASWLYGSAESDRHPVRHNLDRSLLDQLIEAIGDWTVDELVVHAPFYDHQCRALSELVARLSPTHLQVLLQEGRTSVDPDRLDRVLAAAPCEVQFHSVQAEESGTFLHAKFVLARCSEAAVCLQGSPNLSSPALLQSSPAGNIELANLLIGEHAAFDHLVSDLVVSPKPVELATLGLHLAKDDSSSDDQPGSDCVRELTWVPPDLAGVFIGEVKTPPELMVGETIVDDATWHLEEPVGGTTRFSVRVGDHGGAVIDRVESVRFVFDNGDRSTSVFPYHTNSLSALASGQGRMDLLKRAGDFDIDDEELEHLLTQLDEVLVVDGRSLWRIFRRRLPEPVEEGDEPRVAYEELDWETIQSHPKLKQYQSWDRPSATDPTGLGILLGSIADRFRSEVEQRSGLLSAGQTPLEDPFHDLASTSEAEVEEAVEDEQAELEKRRLSARDRAKGQFQRFAKRFAKGIVDDEFVALVGPSVIVPSYVVFNHLCWKLVQLELADPIVIVDIQATLWRFFWGDSDRSGFIAGLSEKEQEAAVEILERHNAEAVLLASLLQAYDVVSEQGSWDELTRLRDVWRMILTHTLWQPTAGAVADASTVAGPTAITPHELLKGLESLARFISEREKLQIVEMALGARPGTVETRTVKMNRGPGDSGATLVAEFVVVDPDAVLTPVIAKTALTELRAVLPAPVEELTLENPEPNNEYIQLTHPSTRSRALADFKEQHYVFVDLAAGVDEELDLPDPPVADWENELDALYSLTR